MAAKKKGDKNAKPGRDAKGRFLRGNPTQWKKGKPGGPGRPKGDILHHIRAIAEQESQKTGKTMGEALAWKLYELAMKKGNIQAIRELLNRIHGTPVQHIIQSLDIPDQVVLDLRDDDESEGDEEGDD